MGKNLSKTLFVGERESYLADRGRPCAVRPAGGCGFLLIWVQMWRDLLPSALVQQRQGAHSFQYISMG